MRVNWPDARFLDTYAHGTLELHSVRELRRFGHTYNAFGRSSRFARATLADVEGDVELLGLHQSWRVDVFWFDPDPKRSVVTVDHSLRTIIVGGRSSGRSSPGRTDRQRE